MEEGIEWDEKENTKIERKSNCEIISIEKESLLRRIDNVLVKWCIWFEDICGRLVGKQEAEKIDIVMLKPIRDELIDICGVYMINGTLNVELKNLDNDAYTTFTDLNKNLKELNLPWGPFNDKGVVLRINYDDNTFDLDLNCGDNTFDL